MTKTIMDPESFELALDIIDLYLELQQQREYVLTKKLSLSPIPQFTNITPKRDVSSEKDLMDNKAIAYKVASQSKYLKWLQAGTI
ncbi:MAG: hypothetical protein Fur0025_39110 [Oscillatoriaceae cyanobacterium]